MIKKLTIALFSLVLFTTACKKSTDTTNPVVPPVNPTLADNDPLLLGNPTEAATSVSMTQNYLIDQTYYKEAYNSVRGIPRWVAWHLQSEDQGSTARQGDFRPDTKLPTSWYQVTASSYSTGGQPTFDRGHNCPSGDRTASIPQNSSTFLMTNMIPQAPSFNQGTWGTLENYIRTIVGTNYEAYIYMGNYGQGGVGSNGVTTQTVDNGNVWVPAQVYKIVVIMPKGTGDLSRIDTSATILAVNMPNSSTVFPSGSNNAWHNYVTTISSIEQSLTANGYDANFLSSVNATVRNYLKTKVYQ